MQDHFHTHPKGRLHEFLFWSGLGVVLGIGGFVGWRTQVLSTPIALLTGIVALCFIGWAFLPQSPHVQAAPAKTGRSRRR